MLKVVIVDDEKMICSLISQLLDWEELGGENSRYGLYGDRSVGNDSNKDRIS